MGEAVTVLEAPPMVVVGIVAYKETPVGLKSLGTVWAHHVSTAFKRRYYKNWKQSAQKAFTQLKRFQKTRSGVAATAKTLQRFAKKGVVVRVIAHTQAQKLRNHRIGTKKAHIAEVQVNGGTIAQKLELAKSLLEKEVRVDTVFRQSEACDVVAVTKGHGLRAWCTARASRACRARRTAVCARWRASARGTRSACRSRWPARVRTVTTTART